MATLDGTSTICMTNSGSDFVCFVVFRVYAAQPAPRGQRWCELQFQSRTHTTSVYERTLVHRTMPPAQSVRPVSSHAKRRFSTRGVGGDIPLDNAADWVYSDTDYSMAASDAT